MEVSRYIKRINYEGDLVPTLAVLQQLQKAHLLNVPFENLDIHSNQKIELNIELLYNKVVVRNRGGFCYELNGLFNTLLQSIGFDSKLISGNVYDKKSNSFGKDFDHLAIIVRLANSDYLVDVGFGEFTFHPLLIHSKEVQSDPRGQFIVEPYSEESYCVFKVDHDRKSIEYKFKKSEHLLVDFTGMCHYHQTSPQSHFTHKRLISRPTETGRITITENTLKITERNNTVKEEIFSDSEFSNYLMKWFGIPLPQQ